MSGTLYFGDNLDVLREHIRDESADLVYLDPPFNSAASYNVLFRAPDGHSSTSQIQAFEDTWSWNDASERAFDDVMRSGRTDVANVLRAMRQFLRENDMMAYLSMMAVRLIELHRTIKSTGAIYLHCDPTASHYLKILMDATFGPSNFLNEVIWKRTGAHGGARRWGPIHDTILFYAKSRKYTWNKTLQAYEQSYIDKEYKHRDAVGVYRRVTLTGAGTRKGDSGLPWRGTDPTQVGRHWAIPTALVQAKYPDVDATKLSTQEKLELLDKCGLLHWPKIADGVPQLKRYLAEVEGNSIQDIILDINPLNKPDRERLGYPTQKPLSLLERIIQSSSSRDDFVLDPFCGCGTAVHAAQKLGRGWTGIDITPLAVNLIARRLKDAFPGIAYEVRGIPKDMDGAHELFARDRHLFQLWATDIIGAAPYRDGKKGADGGVDGMIYFKPDGRVTKAAIVSVKGGANREVSHVRDLRGTIERLQEPMGVLVTLHPPTEPMRREAAAAGLYDSGFGKPTPRIQIVTVEHALKLGERAVQLPYGYSASFKQAPREAEVRNSAPDLFGQSAATPKPRSRKSAGAPPKLPVSIPEPMIAKAALDGLLDDGAGVATPQ